MTINNFLPHKISISTLSFIFQIFISPFPDRAQDVSNNLVRKVRPIRTGPRSPMSTMGKWEFEPESPKFTILDSYP